MHFYKKSLIIIFACFIAGIVLFMPTVSFAAGDAQRVTSFFGFDTSSPQAWINSIYRYGIMLIGFASVAGIAYGGIRYLTSMGNQEAVTSGKQAIVAALSGLAIMLLSHMILRTIDPRLVELRLTVPAVDLGRCSGDSDCGENEICVSAGTDASRCESRDADRSSTECSTNEECEAREGTGSTCLSEPYSHCSDPQLGRESGRGCDANSDCEGDLVCVTGLNPSIFGDERSRCSDRSIGSPCNSPSHCESGNCQNNLCAEESGTGRQGLGQSCDNDEDCESGVCSESCVAGDGRSSDGTCRSSSGCLDTHYCPCGTLQRCTPRLRAGGICYSDRDCESGLNCDGWPLNCTLGISGTCRQEQ